MMQSIQTSQGPIETLDLQLPVFLPGENRNWSEFMGMAKITNAGEIFIRFQDLRANTRLVNMALEKILMAISFDYRPSEAQIKEINERYTKKIVSRVGTHPVQIDGKDVGTAYIFTDGEIQVKLDGNPLTYVVDTTKKKDEA